MKKRLMVLGLSGTLLGAGLVGAQQSGGPAAGNQAAQTGEDAATLEAQETSTERAAMFAQRLLHRPLDMGSTLTVTFYDGDPEAGGNELSTAAFIYGEDSEAAFAEQIETAAAEAAYVTVTTSPQTETYNLTELSAEGPSGFGGFGGPRFGNRGPGGFGQDGFGGHRR